MGTIYRKLNIQSRAFAVVSITKLFKDAQLHHRGTFLVNVLAAVRNKASHNSNRGKSMSIK